MSDKKFRKLKIDEELRDLLPPQTDEEHKILEESIKNNGCTSPIYIWNDYIVDGHNRYDICEKYNIGFETVALAYESKEDIKMWILDTQLGRRNLTDIQKIIIAERYRDIIKDKAKKNQGNRGNKVEKPIDTRKELAKIAGVGTEKYYRAEKILKVGNEKLKKKLLKGEITINKAYTELFKKKKSRKSISNQVITSLLVRSKGKCECCGFGGQGLENIIIKHHIHKYSETEDNSLNNLIMLCPNCHGIIHTLENCTDKDVKNNILNRINNHDKILELANKLNK